MMDQDSGVEYRRLAFPGIGKWVQVILARGSEEMMAWVPLRTEGLKEGAFLRLKGDPSDWVWTVVFVSDQSLSMTGEAGSILEH